VIRRVANSQPNDHWLVSVSRCPLLVEFSLASPIKARNGRIYAIIRGIDKVNVVTYLLYAHLPKKGQSSKSTPEYLIKEPPEGPRNRDLTYFEDPGLTERLSWVSSTYGLPRVDIIENIILNF